jgi:chromosome condensin MukBEF MukE localization factor
MRTTLTLDEDVASKLRQEARRTGESFKQVVNRVLRLGLTAKPGSAARNFRVRDIGFRLGFDFECASEAIERLEGPAKA